MSKYCSLPDCFLDGLHDHSTRNKAEPEIVTMLVEQTRRLKATIAELQTEKDRVTHAFNMLQHDSIEANRIHNEAMNEQAKEIERLSKERDVLSRGLDIETAEIESLHKEIERLRKLARLRVSSGHGILCCCANCQELKNALGGSK